MKGNQFWQDDIDTVDGTATGRRYDLGVRRTEHPESVIAGAYTTAAEGEREWIYLFNDDTAAFAQGNSLVRDAGTVINEYDAILSDGTGIPAVRCLALAQFAVAAGAHAWGIRQGAAEAMSDATITQDEFIRFTNNTASGRVGSVAGTTTLGTKPTYAESHSLVGHALDTQATKGSLASVVLDLA